MSVELTIRCDGTTPAGRACPAVYRLPQGHLRARKAPRGWTRTRAAGQVSSRRPRRDWCPECSRRRAVARTVLSGPDQRSFQ